MVYYSICVSFDFKAAFGQVYIANDFSQIVSTTFLGHIPELHCRDICMTLRPIKLLYSFLESAHYMRIVHFNAAKVLLLFETAKHFNGKFYYEGKKGGESAKYSHARVVSDKFCIVSDLDLWEKQCTFAVELRQ